MSVATASHAATDAKHNLKAVREAYYDKISKYDMAPLWEVLKNVVTAEPRTKCKPATTAVLLIRPTGLFGRA